MMDYEMRILMLEKDLAHLQEMRKLQSARSDAHDTSIESLMAIIYRIEANVERISAGLAGLIDALLKQHPNGETHE